MSDETTERTDEPHMPLRPYAEIIAPLRDTHPACAELLFKAERNRASRLGSLARGARLRGIEELFNRLNAHEALYRSDARLAPAARLLARAIASFGVALEASLSGMHGVVYDAMRSVMEVEFLLRDFRHVPAHLPEWLSATEKERLKRFKPAVLRERHAARVGTQPELLPEALDYKVHSQTLHISPVPPPGSGIHDDSDPWLSDSCFWEMYEHGRRVLWEVYRFAEAFAPELDAASPDDMAAFRDGWERTQNMFELVRALREASAPGHAGAPKK